MIDEGEKEEVVATAKFNFYTVDNTNKINMLGLESKDELNGSSWYTTDFINESSPEVKNFLKRYELNFYYTSPIQDNLKNNIAILEIVSSKDISFTMRMELNNFVEDIERIWLSSKAVEETLNARDLAEQASKAKSDFLANMSHEIRTPMNAIIGFNELLKNTKVTKKQAEYVEKTGTSAVKLLGIINDILDFSKIEAGKILIEKTNFSLDKVLEDVSNVVAIKAFQKDLEFIVKKDVKLPVHLIGDPLRLSQVLINLVNNAVKFTETGQVSIDVEKVAEEQSEVFYKFSVVDTGVGLAKDKLDTLFEAFKQADTSITRRYGGTGLGLTISQSLVHVMGGNIEVSSEVNQGSKFYFTLPFTLSTGLVDNDIQIPQNIGDIKVLVVDDNKDSLDVCESYLKELSIVSNTAMSGEDAVSIIDDTYDLVIMDWKMPGMDGISAWKEIRSKLKEQLPRIFLLTAYGKEDIYMKAREAGIQTVLTKPITKSVMYDTIMNCFSTEYFVEKQTSISNIKRIESIQDTHILIVEDNEMNQMIMKEILENSGLRVSVAEHGLEAVNMMNEDNDYDLVFMDLHMPVMNGYDSSNRIRQDGYKLPIIALTADVVKGVPEKIKECGMNGYITKPIVLRDVYKVLTKWINAGDLRVDMRNETMPSSEDSKTIREVFDKYDVEDALERIQYNEQLYITLLQKYYDKISNILERIESASSLEEIKDIIHNLKGVSSNIGAIDVVSKILHLQKELNDEKDVFNTLLYIEFRNQIEHDMKYIRKGLDFFEKQRLSIDS